MLETRVSNAFYIEMLETRVSSTFFDSKCWKRAFRVLFLFRFAGFAIQGAHLAREGHSRSSLCIMGEQEESLADTARGRWPFGPPPSGLCATSLKHKDTWAFRQLFNRSCSRQQLACQWTSLPSAINREYKQKSWDASHKWSYKDKKHQQHKRSKLSKNTFCPRSLLWRHSLVQTFSYKRPPNIRDSEKIWLLHKQSDTLGLYSENCLHRRKYPEVKTWQTDSSKSSFSKIFPSSEPRTRNKWICE